METITSNPELVSYILYQRTEFLRFGNQRILRRLLPYHLLVQLDSRLFSKKVISEYEDDIQNEWENIYKFLPQKATKTMDIGCGIGLINAFIFHRFSQPSNPTQLYLVDRDKLEDKVYYEFEPKGAAYNSLANSRQYLESKGVPSQAIHSINIEEERLPQTEKFDLILSLISWGYHYPLDTYLEYVKNHLSDEGVLILDCNVRTNAVEVLKQNFNVKIIKTEPTYHRVQATKLHLI